MNRMRIILAVCSLLGLAYSALAVENLYTIYDRQTKLPENLTFGDWGFLARGEEAATAFAPVAFNDNGARGTGLLITTKGRYQGARFDFQRPFNADALNEKNTYLEVYLRALPNKGTIDGMPVKPVDPIDPNNPMPPYNPGPGGVGPMPPNGMPGGEPVPGMPPDGIPGMPPYMDPNMGPGGFVDPYFNVPAEFKPEQKKPLMVPMPTFKNLRFTFFTEKGQGQLSITPDEFFPKTDVGGVWIRVAIPFTALNKALPVGGKLTRLLIASDEPTEFYLGRLAIIRDDEPLTIRTNIFPTFLEAGKRIFFRAHVTSGLSRWEVTWDFDTNAGVSVDATGDRVTYTFDRPGRYAITATIRDLNGNKVAVSSKAMEIKVSEAAPVVNPGDPGPGGPYMPPR